MAQNKIRVRLKSYDSTIIDAAAAKVVDVAKRNGSKVRAQRQRPPCSNARYLPYGEKYLGRLSFVLRGIWR